MLKARDNRAKSRNSKMQKIAQIQKVNQCTKAHLKALWGSSWKSSRHIAYPEICLITRTVRACNAYCRKIIICLINTVSTVSSVSTVSTCIAVFFIQYKSSDVKSKQRNAWPWESTDGWLIWWCAIDVVFMWCWCGVDVVLMRYWCGIDAVLMRCWCGIDSVRYW